MLMPMHDHMSSRVQIFAYIQNGLLRTMMELLTKQEKIEQIFFSMQKKHQQKYAETHRTILDDHLPLICFLNSVKTLTMQAESSTS